MTRSHTMNPAPRRERRGSTALRTVCAVLLFLCAAGLAYLAGDAAKYHHDWVLCAGTAPAALMLGAAGLVVLYPWVPRRARRAVTGYRRRPAWAPPAEAVPLPDDLYDAAAEIADAFLSMDPVDRAGMHVELFGNTLSDGDLVLATTEALTHAEQALTSTGRYSDALRSTYTALAKVCAPAGSAFLATLASDLIRPGDWNVLTAYYRDRGLTPILPIPVETRHNTPAGRQ